MCLEVREADVPSGSVLGDASEGFGPKAAGFKLKYIGGDWGRLQESAAALLGESWYSAASSDSILLQPPCGSGPHISKGSGTPVEITISVSRN